MTLPYYCPDAGSSTRYLFFTGKGGVGKTSLSCATAIALADQGRRVLLVSTDPASNLDEVLATKLSNTPEPVPGITGLDALNIDPIAAAEAYRERVIGPVRKLLPQAALQSMEEQLSGACTVEIAAFDEFSGLIGDASVSDNYDHVVFDTAPTGHTLRLMGLAKAWDHFLDASTSATSCLGPLAGLERQRAVYAQAVKTLSDPSATTLLLVSRPQSAALAEAERTSTELQFLGIANQRLVINGVFETFAPDDPIAAAMQQRGSDAIAAARHFIASLPTSLTPLRPTNILGIDGLRSLLDRKPATPPARQAATTIQTPDSLHDLLANLESPGGGLIMTMGKGGVGKTTIAAAIALELARRGHRVHLTTTDPAAHLAHTLAAPSGQSAPLDGLSLSCIDPAAETAAYTAEVLRSQVDAMDDASRALLEEDLRSPCTEEIAVFRAFAREVAKAADQFVVLDTAPTGHTLLLLDASQAYHREFERQTRSTPSDAVTSLLGRLRDPNFTRVLIVTLPEATPVHEAAALQQDLRRAQIEPFAWVINQSLLHSGTVDPLLQSREAAEFRYFYEVTEQLSSRTAWLPWQPTEPVGLDALAMLAAPAPSAILTP